MINDNILLCYHSLQQPFQYLFIIMATSSSDNKSESMSHFYQDSDKYLYQHVIEPLSGYFKDVNPNLITIIGLPLSFGFFLLHLHPYGYSLFFPVFIISLLRLFCDFMDGHVARKYNKCSKLGGFLDTLSDMIHVTNALVYILTCMFDSTWVGCVFWWLSAFTVNMLNTAYGGALVDHDKMKNGKGLNGLILYMGKYHAFLLNVCYFGLIYMLGYI